MDLALTRSTAGELVIGRYLVGGRLALGGMGEVRLATQTGPGGYHQPIALKLLLPHMAEDPAAVEMFLHEARLASAMSHPNVVRILDVGTDSGRYFIAMELVRGGSLSTFIRALREAGAAVPLEVLDYVAFSLCEGLQYVHALKTEAGDPLGLVHRDVTPHNVLLSVQGEVKLADFGIAKVRDAASHTQAGTIKGKLEYLSPEQLHDAPIDGRVDVFGAGVTLFQLATGVSPFRRSTEGATLMAVRSEPLPSARELRPDLPERWVAALQRACAKDPEERFASARAFRDAIAPEVRAQSAELLGNLIRTHCAEALERLDASEKTLPAIAREGPTASISGDPRRRKWRGPLGVGLLALAALATAGLLRGGPPEPVSAPAPPRVASTPVSPEQPEAPPSRVTAPLNPEPAPDSKAKTQREARQRAAGTARSTPGFLSIDADPWAAVSLDGRAIGDTPIARFPVSPGQVRVTLKNPENGKGVVRKLRIVSGAEQRLRIDLR